jgi:putative alpha-1,2-mannosidase
VKILLPEGKFFLVSSVNRENKNKYIRAITMDGGKYSNWYITHEDIIRGGRFTFQLNPKPPLK